MKFTLIFSLLTFVALMSLQAQENALPFREIPPKPEQYKAGTMMARLVEGLGYRYYWATEGLNQADLDYRPTAEARSVWETLEHLYGLSETIANAALQKPNLRPMKDIPQEIEAMRAATLEHLETARDIFIKSEAADFEDYEVIFQRGGQNFEFPFWNMINGPMADALNHVGQIVSFRRSSGNPINPKVNVFLGKAPE
ncbi:MAG: hypothetical protein AAFU64_01230 [Bacteroidota bacterium]